MYLTIVNINYLVLNWVTVQSYSWDLIVSNNINVLVTYLRFFNYSINQQIYITCVCLTTSYYTIVLTRLWLLTLISLYMFANLGPDMNNVLSKCTQGNFYICTVLTFQLILFTQGGALSLRNLFYRFELSFLVNKTPMVNRHASRK